MALKNIILPRPRWCNCWIWAQFVYWRYGGYVMKRQSLLSPIINHYFWSEDAKTWWSYVAVDRKSGRDMRGWAVKALLFHGELVLGDMDAVVEDEKLVPMVEGRE